jgi:CubicO group peptidase (beta-lactamase class C family)
VSQRAYGHSKKKGKWEESDQSPTSATLGDGGIYSNLEDLAKWDRALRYQTFLKKEELELLLTPVVVDGPGPVEPDGTPAAYGFGWFLNPWRGHARMWHYGITSGFRTAIQRFLDRQLTVIVLANRTDLEARSLSLQIASCYLD